MRAVAKPLRGGCRAPARSSAVDREVLVARPNLEGERLAARSSAATAALPLARDHARLRAAAAALALPVAVAAVAVAAALPGAMGHALYGDEVASARIVTETGA